MTVSGATAVVGQGITATVTVQNPDGIPVEGATVSFQVGGSATVATAGGQPARTVVVVTDAQGRATVTVTDAVAEQVNLSVAVDSATVTGSPIVLTFASAASGLPAPTVTRPMDGDVVITTRPAFVGTSVPGATVTVADETGVLCTAVVGTNGAWTCTPRAAMAAGAHAGTVVATDTTGAISPQTRLVVFIDRGQTSATDTGGSGSVVGTGGSVAPATGWPALGALLAAAIWSIGVVAMLSRRRALSGVETPKEPRQ